MATVSEREMIKRAYPHSPKWAARVNKMPDNQVIAIFYKLKREGKI